MAKDTQAPQAPQAPCLSPIPIYPDLHGKVAVVTGMGQVGPDELTSWGNGAAAARYLAGNGVSIFGCDKNLEAAKKSKQRILAEHPDATIEVMAADVTSVEDVENFIKATRERFGRIDILFNNVGMLTVGNPGNMSPEVWNQQIDLNLSSVYRLCHFVLPIMQQQKPPGGSIINNASITGLRYIGKHQIGYSSAKAAVIAFSKATGVMYAEDNIRCNAVAPGLMYTPMVQNLELSDDPGEKHAADKITKHNVPMGWMGAGEDVANVVLWLASAVSRYVTSQAIVVDGGLTESTGTGSSD
jgi:NAD(P)-dependent dehydrogenase (short-subunit alcohol dehydrogenase family)